MGSNPPRFARLLMALLTVIAVIAAGCGDDDAGDARPPVTATPEAADTQPTVPAQPPVDGATAEPTTTEATAIPSPTGSEEPTAEPPPDERIVNVYWLSDTQIAVGGRMVEMPALAGGALRALLAGPNELERELGMSSAIPRDTKLLGLSIDDGVATVDLSEHLEATGMGTSGEIGLVSQIVFTLTQFPNVDAVDIIIEGQPRDAILSHGLEATGLTREALFDAVSPAIVVESPYPGQLVTSPLTVSGFSRTFEATVVYDVTVPPSDEIVAEGFTTAAQPDASRFGAFEFTVEFQNEVAGFGSVIVFEESAKDGAQINIYEVPVMMQ